MQACGCATGVVMAGRNGAGGSVCLVTKAWRYSAVHFANELAAGLAEAGVAVTLLAPLAEPGSAIRSTRGLRQLVVPNENIASDSKLVRRVRSVARVLFTIGAVARCRLRERVFLFTIPDPLPFFLAQLLIVRATRGRSILVVHDATPHAWTLPPRLRGIERFLLGLTYRLADALVTLSQANGAVLRETFGISPAKIHRIPHGAIAAPAGTRPLPGHGQVLLFGSLRRNKRVREAIEAFAILRDRAPDMSLLIAGHPYPHELDYWRECAQRIAEADANIRCEIGFVPEERLGEIMAETDAVLLPYEEFSSQSGVAVLAAQHRRPVIATRAGGLAELFDEGMAGSVIKRPATPGTIAEAVAAFAAVPVGEWRERAERASEQLRTYLSWERICLEYKTLIEALDGGWGQARKPVRTMPALIASRQAGRR